MSGHARKVKVGAASGCFLVDLAYMQYSYTYGLTRTSIRQFQLLIMKAPQFGHGSPKRCPCVSKNTVQNPVSIQSLRSTLLYTRRDACDTRQKRTDRCNSNSVLRSFLNARPKKHNCIGELTFQYVFIMTIIFYCTSSTFEGGSRHML